MVAFPVRLFKAARRERIRFRNVYRPADVYGKDRPTLEKTAGADPIKPKGGIREFPNPASAGASTTPKETVARIGNLPVGEVAEERIEGPQRLKGYEIERDRYVTFEPQEVAALRPETSTELDIAEFARLDEIDPIFFETSYYVAPDRGGEKAYALLFRVLAETGYAAIGSLSMHGREHATVIRPGRRGLILHTLFYANEVRTDEEYNTAADQVTAKELELAKQFVRLLAARFEPEKLKDAFEVRLHEMIRARSETAIGAYKHSEVVRRAAVVDIMEALRKSLEVARKPPKSEKAEVELPRTRGPRSHS